MLQTIIVTQKHIDEGIAHNPDRCPLALAATDAFKDTLGVPISADRSLYVNAPEGRMSIALLAGEHPIQPTEFTIELTEYEFKLLMSLTAPLRGWKASAKLSKPKEMHDDKK
jgi:hypothetical protein